MQPSTRNQLLNLGLLAAAAALVAFYVRDKARATPTPAQPDETIVQPLEEGITPESLLRSTISIEAPGPVSANTTGHSAMVVGRTDLRYAWTIEGGKLETDAATSAVQWSSGPAGTLRLSCEVTDAKGTKVTIATSVVVEPQPQIQRFEVRNAVLSEGGKTQIAWEARDAKTLVLGPDEQDLTAKPSGFLEVQPAKTTTYTLKAGNGAGTTVSRDVTVKVVPPPALLGTRGEGAVGQGRPITLVCDFANGRAELRKGTDVLSSSTESPLRVQVPDPPLGTVYQFVVTNEAGASVSQTLNIVAPPKPK